jgi:hypothetical protein
MSFVATDRPQPDASRMSERTRRLRPAIAMTDEQIVQARCLRREDELEPEEIARLVDGGPVPVEEVEKALIGMRTKKANASRCTLNVSVAAHQFVRGEKEGDEAGHEIVDRLLDELIRRRREMGD